MNAIKKTYQRVKNLRYNENISEREDVRRRWQCPQCGGDDFIGRSFHSPQGREVCRDCAVPPILVEW